MRLCGGPTHPLIAAGAADVSAVSSAELLRHDFVCPQHSFICGVTRARHEHGWRNYELPRRICYWVDDLVLPLALAKSGAALSYLPEFALKNENQLVPNTGQRLPLRLRRTGLSSASAESGARLAVAYAGGN